MAQQGPVPVPAYGVALYRVPRPRVVLGGVVLGAGVAVTWLATKAVSPIEYVVATDELALALVALWALRPKRLAAQRREGQAGERSARGLPVPLPSGLAARFAILAGMSTDDIDRRALSATLPLDVPDEEIAGVRDVSFPIVMRGYDRAAVDAYVTRVNRIIAELQVSRSPQSAIRHALDQVSEETRGILERAHETADDITKRSQVESGERLQRAEDEARALMADAEARVRELQVDVEAIERERARLIEDVRVIAAELHRVASDAEPEPEPEPEPQAAAPDDETLAIDADELEQAESVDADPAPPPFDSETERES